MSNRRAIVVALAASVVAAPLVIRAQSTLRTARVGYLSTGSSRATYMRPLEAFRERLGQLGWIEGRNLVIEYRWAEVRPERLAALAEELVRLQVDVIAASPTPAVIAARNATRTIPIVGMGLTEPVAVGVVSSLAKPGGNVTGVTYSVDADIFGKQLELLREIVPRVHRVALLVNPAGGSPALQLTIDNVQAAARALGLQLVVVEATGPAAFEGAFATMERERAEALLFTGDAMFFLNRERLAELAAKGRWVSMSTQAQWPEAGGLASYGPDLPELWRRGATLVDRVLRGAKPAELPIEQPAKFELVVNLKTARALRLAIPPVLLQRADRVIE